MRASSTPGAGEGAADEPLPGGPPAQTLCSPPACMGRPSASGPSLSPPPTTEVNRASPPQPGCPSPLAARPPARTLGQGTDLGTCGSEGQIPRPGSFSLVSAQMGMALLGGASCRWQRRATRGQDCPGVKPSGPSSSPMWQQLAPWAQTFLPIVPPLRPLGLGLWVWLLASAGGLVSHPPTRGPAAQCVPGRAAFSPGV